MLRLEQEKDDVDVTQLLNFRCSHPSLFCFFLGMLLLLNMAGTDVASLVYTRDGVCFDYRWVHRASVSDSPSRDDVFSLLLVLLGNIDSIFSIAQFTFSVLCNPFENVKLSYF